MHPFRFQGNSHFPIGIVKVFVMVFSSWHGQYIGNLPFWCVEPLSSRPSEFLLVVLVITLQHTLGICQLCNTYASCFFLSYCMGLKISNLIASEIIRNEDINARVSAIEKWVAVADICRCLHNYNAVLEITSSMNRSAIFRLKKTWLKVSKQVRAGGGHRGRPGAGLGWGTGVLASGHL